MVLCDCLYAVLGTLYGLAGKLHFIVTLIKDADDGGGDDDDNDDDDDADGDKSWLWGHVLRWQWGWWWWWWWWWCINSKVNSLKHGFSYHHLHGYFLFYLKVYIITSMPSTLFWIPQQHPLGHSRLHPFVSAQLLLSSHLISTATSSSPISISSPPTPFNQGW